MIELARFVIAAFVAFVTTRVLARRASSGWRDAPSESERARKPQGRGVPAVGGVALLFGVIAAQMLRGGSILGLDPLLDAGAGLAALVLALGLGMLDDRRSGGLSPIAKIAGQLVCVAPLGWSVHMSLGPGVAAFMVVAGLAGMNLANTWDHHDGALSTLGLAGFGLAGLRWPGAWLWGGALAGFLPCNLNADEREGPSATPTAYLGDGGSHLIGLGAILVPGAWPLLLIPALDLLRLSWERTRAGSRPWIGDRRHLSHRLMERLGSRRRVAFTTTAIAIPALWGAHVSAWPSALSVGRAICANVGPPVAIGWELWAGLGLSSALYLASLRLSRTG